MIVIEVAGVVVAGVEGENGRVPQLINYGFAPFSKAAKRSGGNLSVSGSLSAGFYSTRRASDQASESRFMSLSYMQAEFR